jgi:hypothetical protein
MKKIIVLSAALLLGTSFASNAQTASATASQSVALSLSNAIAITFVTSGTTTGTAVSIPFATVADYTNGVASAAQQLKVQSNKTFHVFVNTSSTNFTYSGTTSPAPTMPVAGVLAAQVTANATGGAIATPFSGAYGGLTSSSQNIINTGLNGGNQTFSIQYMATPGFAYPAGTYTANVIYTATQP